MNRNYVLIAAVVVLVALAFSMMRSGVEDAGGEETAPTAATE